MRYKLVVEYLGAGLAGWQRQRNALSVQELIENAIFSFSGEIVKVYSAGRTDAGVNAYGQVCHFDLNKQFEAFRVMEAINHYLKPSRVIILECEEVSAEFHARFSCIARSYEYVICNRHSRLALDYKRAWHVKEYLDAEKMHIAAQHLIGTHDFTSFRASECQASSPVKTMQQINVTRERDKIKFYLKAQSFLHHMVRNIVGTLYFVGKGELLDTDIIKILEAKQRKSAGITAPPEGLYFVKAYY